MSRDADGHPALRLALQTREQHIRREKATSNICTAQVLLAVVAACYAVYHGPDGLRRIARRAHRMAAVLAAGLRAGGIEVRARGVLRHRAGAWCPGGPQAVVDAAHDAGILLRRVDADTVGIACSEVTTTAHLEAVWAAFGVRRRRRRAGRGHRRRAARRRCCGSSDYLTHPVFHEHRSETALMRWLRRLADADLALDRTMIPLGSCTMKLNAAAEMEADHLARVRRPAPVRPGRRHRGLPRADRRPGALAGRADRVRRGVAAAQRGQPGRVRRPAGHRRLPPLPRRGAPRRLPDPGQRARHQRGVGGDGRDAGGRGGHRDRPATSTWTTCTPRSTSTAPRLAALMITYPSTHGVFETEVREVCDAVHAAGGQVYVDGANLNALVGVARPGAFGGDVSHLNLHKTFCIPHGGGGPGVGPVAVAEHLAPFLPGRTPGRGRGRPGLGGAVRQPGGAPDLLGLPAADGPRRAAPGHPDRDRGGQLRGRPAAASTTRCSTPGPAGGSPTSASSICGRSPRSPA